MCFIDFVGTTYFSRVLSTSSLCNHLSAKVAKSFMSRKDTLPSDLADSIGDSLSLTSAFIPLSPEIFTFLRSLTEGM